MIIFTNITFNGQDLNEEAVLRSVAESISAMADRKMYEDEGYVLHQVSCSLFDILDEITGVADNLIEWLSDHDNRNDPEYSDIYKDVYGFRPRCR